MTVPALQSPRLLLRMPEPADAQTIFDEYARDAAVTRYLTWEPHASVDTVAAWLDEAIEKCRMGDELVWTIVRKSDPRIIGMIGARLCGHKADIGYVLARAHWNRGFMTEAIVAVTDWALAQPAIRRVWAVCDVENIGSARVLEKAGFDREGILRGWLIHPGQSNEPRDCYVYSIVGHRDLVTRRLRIRLQSLAEVERMLEAMTDFDRAQVSPDWLDRLRTAREGDPWSFAYRVLLRDTAVEIGTCSFKGPPADGVVEIAYAIDEAHRDLGYATEAARALVDFAFARAEVRLVRAHTLPDAAASRRVLEKSGFRYVGETLDQEDGTVARYEQPAPPASL